MAGLRCTGRIGECRYKVGVGDIQLDQAGPLRPQDRCRRYHAWNVPSAIAEITTGSGALVIGSIDGAAVVKNSNGDTLDRRGHGRPAGEARPTAGSPSTRRDAAVTAKTANGDVRLGEVARGAVVAETASGTLEVGIRDGTAAWLDLNTRFGNVQNDLEAAGPSRAGRGRGRGPRPHLLRRHHRPPFLRERRRKGGGMTTTMLGRRSRQPACASRSATRRCSTAST